MDKQRKYKNYTVLLLLILFMAIMFGLTIVKMTKKSEVIQQQNSSLNVKS